MYLLVVFAPILGWGGPVITEFMAINDSVLADQDGEFSDWVEVHNPSSESLSLEGYFLTDRSDDLTKWEFPDVVLDAGGYVIVFASNKVPVEGELRSNFKLSGGGEFLGLVAPDGATILSSFDFGQQKVDVSFGLLSGGGEG